MRNASGVTPKQGGVIMVGTGRRYAPEFKARMVGAGAGRAQPCPPGEEFEPSSAAISEEGAVRGPEDRRDASFEHDGTTWISDALGSWHGEHESRQFAASIEWHGDGDYRLCLNDRPIVRLFWSVEEAARHAAFLIRKAGVVPDDEIGA